MNLPLRRGAEKKGSSGMRGKMMHDAYLKEKEQRRGDCWDRGMHEHSM